MSILTLDLDALGRLATRFTGKNVTMTVCNNPEWLGYAHHTKLGYFTIGLSPKLLRMADKTMLAFTFWHEVGHVVSKHLAAPGDMNWRVNAPLSPNKYNELCELEADEFGRQYSELFASIHPDTSFWEMFVTEVET